MRPALLLLVVLVAGCNQPATCSQDAAEWAQDPYQDAMSWHAPDGRRILVDRANNASLIQGPQGTEGWEGPRGYLNLDGRPQELRNNDPEASGWRFAANQIPVGLEPLAPPTCTGSTATWNSPRGAATRNRDGHVVVEGPEGRWEAQPGPVDVPHALRRLAVYTPANITGQNTTDGYQAVVQVLPGTHWVDRSSLEARIVDQSTMETQAAQPLAPGSWQGATWNVTLHDAAPAGQWGPGDRLEITMTGTSGLVLWDTWAQQPVYFAEP